MKVLVVNAGSSSIKYQVLDMTDETVLAVGLVDRVGIPGSTLEHKPLGKEAVLIKKDLPDHTAGMELVLEVLVNPEYGVVKNMDEIGAVGHRVVHGGESFPNQSSMTCPQGYRDCFDMRRYIIHNLMGVKPVRSLYLMSNMWRYLILRSADYGTCQLHVRTAL